MSKLMPLPLTVSCFSKIQLAFTFLVLAQPSSPGQMAGKWVCVCDILKINQNTAFCNSFIERPWYRYLYGTKNYMAQQSNYHSLIRLNLALWAVS